MITILFASCEKAIFDEELDSSPIATFDYMWDAIHNRYALFEYKKVNWDLVKLKYRPLIHNEMTDDELFVVLSKMLDELKDGHANLESSFNRSRSWQWFLEYPQNFNRTIQQRNYLKDGYMVTGSIEHQMIDSIGYLYIGSFEKEIRTEDVDYVFNRYKNAKGLIIDIRNNGGGSARNIFQIACRIVPQKTDVYSSWFKTGPAPTDFGDEIKVYAEPSGAFQFNKKVIVLTNRACYSAANRFAAVFSSFPNVIIIGDRTGGGGGTPCLVELPNGWTLRFSAMKTLLPNGYNIDEGIEPDIRIDLSADDEAKGIDSIIERALQEFKRAGI
jgi:hypothetical protein